MEIVIITIQQIIQMFILILFGVLCVKVKLLDSQKSKALSDIVTKIVTPALVISSFRREFKTELAYGLVISLILTALSLGLSYVVVHLLLKKNDKYDSAVERFGAMYSNCGFMGIPLVAGVLGSEGVFYVVGFNLLFNMLVFSLGQSTMRGRTGGSIVKQIVNPVTVASIVAVLLFVLRIDLPDLVGRPIEMIGDMNTPLAMLTAGVSVAQVNFAKVFKKVRLFYVCALKLLIIPILFVLITKFMPVPETVFMTIVLATACPSATVTVLFSVLYGRDDAYASEVFSMTTILSILTIPAVVALAVL